VEILQVWKLSTSCCMIAALALTNTVFSLEACSGWSSDTESIQSITPPKLGSEDLSRHGERYDVENGELGQGASTPSQSRSLKWKTCSSPASSLSTAAKQAKGAGTGGGRRFSRRKMTTLASQYFLAIQLTQTSWQGEEGGGSRREHGTTGSGTRRRHITSSREDQ
jgi:hypothetical protein